MRLTGSWRLVQFLVVKIMPFDLSQELIMRRPFDHEAFFFLRIHMWQVHSSFGHRAWRPRLWSLCRADPPNTCDNICVIGLYTECYLGFSVPRYHLLVRSFKQSLPLDQVGLSAWCSRLRVQWSQLDLRDLFLLFFQ